MVKLTLPKPKDLAARVRKGGVAGQPETDEGVEVKPPPPLPPVLHAVPPGG